MYLNLSYNEKKQHAALIHSLYWIGSQKKKKRKKSPNVTDNLFEVQIKYIFKCHLPLLDHVGMFKEY